MSNPSKKKGTEFESAVVEYMEHFFPDVSRHPAHGAIDKGDVRGVPHFAIECKNHKTFDLAQWVDESRREANNAEARHAAVVHKRRLRPVSFSYVTMELSDWVLLVQKAYGGTAA